MTQTRMRIVAMGDSTTAGTPAFKSPREAPPKGNGDETSQYAYWLMKAHPDWDVVNQGINAQRSDQSRRGSTRTSSRRSPRSSSSSPASTTSTRGVRRST